MPHEQLEARSRPDAITLRRRGQTMWFSDIDVHTARLLRRGERPLHAAALAMLLFVYPEHVVISERILARQHDRVVAGLQIALVSRRQRVKHNRS